MPIPPQEHIANGYEVRAERGAASMKITIRLFITSRGGERSLDDAYILVYTPYITRNGVRIWASQYGKWCTMRGSNLRHSD